MLSIIGRFLPENEKDIAEREKKEQRIKTLEAVTALPETVVSKGFKRSADVSESSINIWDTAPASENVTLDFTQVYTQAWVEALVKDLMAAGINPKTEHISISVRLVFDGGKSVTGSDQTKSFGRSRYSPYDDKIDWISGDS
ncbi:MAG: hypothetical protein B0D91_14130 [Oceanospirillales bacterium LUC14_002_19_P2]|nr:MAG: hypothetical protein B0D91_14130 [Oceanospirillales bacterium LUC14_002_19_P2]